MPPRSVAYSEASGRYRDTATGRWVSSAQVRADLDAALLELGGRAEALARAFQRRELSLARWELEMRRLVKDTQILAAAVAKGGVSQLSQADLGRIGARVKAQYGYLRQWARDIRSGKAPIDGRLVARSVLYVESGRSAWAATRRLEMQRRGFDRIRSRLHPAEHCTGEGSCVEQAQRGWQTFDAYLPLGSRRCGVRDKCSEEFMSTATGQIAR